MNILTEQLREFITENFLFGQQIALADDESLLDSGIIDSTGVLELVTFIEDKYQIVINDADLVPENLDSIDRLTRFVSSKCEASSTISSGV